MSKLKICMYVYIPLNHNGNSEAFPIVMNISNYELLKINEYSYNIDINQIILQ